MSAAGRASTSIHVWIRIGLRCHRPSDGMCTASCDGARCQIRPRPDRSTDGQTRRRKDHDHHLPSILGRGFGCCGRRTARMQEGVESGASVRRRVADGCGTVENLGPTCDPWSLKPWEVS